MQSRRLPASEVAELHARVLGVFRRAGEDLSPAEVAERLGGEIDRHRLTRALTALVGARKLRRRGEKGAARYARR